MDTKPLEIRLTDEERQVLLRAERSCRRSWRSLLSQAIHNISSVGEPRRNDAPIKVGAANCDIAKIIKEFEDLPIEGPHDDFSGRDHDSAIYRK